MSVKLKVDGVVRDVTWVEFFAVCLVFVLLVLAWLLGLAIRLLAYAVPLALALVVAYHVAKCYEDAVIGHQPAAVAKGVDR